MNDWILVIVEKVQRYQMLFQPTSKPADTKAELRFKVVSNQKWDKISTEIVNFLLYVLKVIKSQKVSLICPIFKIINKSPTSNSNVKTVTLLILDVTKL